MGKDVRQQLFDTVRRRVQKDLEGFDRAVLLVKKRRLKKAIEEIEKEKLLTSD